MVSISTWVTTTLNAYTYCLRRGLCPGVSWQGKQPWNLGSFTFSKWTSSINIKEPIIKKYQLYPVHYDIAGSPRKLMVTEQCFPRHMPT